MSMRPAPRPGFKFLEVPSISGPPQFVEVPDTKAQVREVPVDPGSSMEFKASIEPTRAIAAFRANVLAEHMAAGFSRDEAMELIVADILAAGAST